VSVHISDQAFSHTYLYINMQSEVKGWVHPGQCAVILHGCTSAKLCTAHAPNYSSPSNWPGPFPEELTYVLFGH